MFRALRIENFRGIGNLEIRRLQRLNLVTGRNGGGKTSLLEAVFLNCGAANAGLILSVAAFRGDNVIVPESDRIFRTCFNDLESNRHIHIFAEELRQKRSRSRSLRIEAQTRLQQTAGRSTQEQFVTGMKSRFLGPSGEKVSEVRMDFQQPAIPGSEPPLGNPIKIVPADSNPDLIFAQFISPYVRDVHQEVYDQLVAAIKDKSINRIVDVVSLIEKDVKDITPLMERGFPNVYVDIGRLKLMPLASLGAGFLHLLRLALAIAAVQRGIIIIDELEDGIHYSILKDVARVIYRALDNKEVQIFISTHSSELIEAFISVASEITFNDVCLLNMARDQDGFSARYFDKSEMQYALDLDAELR